MQPLIFDVNALVLVVGGILAAAPLLVADRPRARRAVERLAPFQALIGIGLVVLGVIDGLWALPKLADIFTINLLQGAAWLTVVGVSILLGALFGLGPIVKQLAQKLAVYQVLLGLLGLGGSVAYFLYRFHLVTLSA